MEREKISTARDIAHDLLKNGGSEQTLAVIDAGIPQIGSLGDDILVCRMLSGFTEESVRPRVNAVLAKYYPTFDTQNVLIVNSDPE